MLKSIELTDYRSFGGHTKFDLCGQTGIVAISGANGSGKSTLLRALANCLGASHTDPIRSFFPAGRSDSTPTIKLSLCPSSDASLANATNKTAKAARKSQNETRLANIKLVVEHGKKTWFVDNKAIQQQQIQQVLGFVPGFVSQQASSAFISDSEVLRKLLVQSCQASSLDAAFKAAKSKVSAIEKDVSSSSTQIHKLAEVVETSTQLRQLIQKRRISKSVESFAAQIEADYNAITTLLSATEDVICHLKLLQENDELAEQYRQKLDQASSVAARKAELTERLQKTREQSLARRVQRIEIISLSEEQQRICARQKELEKLVEKQSAQHGSYLLQLQEKSFAAEMSTRTSEVSICVYGSEICDHLGVLHRRFGQHSLHAFQAATFEIICKDRSNSLLNMSDLTSMNKEVKLTLDRVQRIARENDDSNAPGALDVQKLLFRAPSALQGINQQLKQDMAKKAGAVQAMLATHLNLVHECAQNVLSAAEALKQSHWRELCPSAWSRKQCSVEVAEACVSPSSQNKDTISDYSQDESGVSAGHSPWDHDLEPLLSALSGQHTQHPAAPFLKAFGTIKPSCIVSVIESSALVVRSCAWESNSASVQEDGPPGFGSERGYLSGVLDKGPISEVPGFLGEVGSLLRFSETATEWQDALRSALSLKQLRKLVCASSTAMKEMLEVAAVQQEPVAVLPIDALQVDSRAVSEKAMLISEHNATCSRAGDRVVCPTSLLSFLNEDISKLGQYLLQRTVFVNSHDDATEFLRRARQRSLTVQVFSRDGVKHTSGWLSGGLMPTSHARRSTSAWPPLLRSKLSDECSRFAHAATNVVELCTWHRKATDLQAAVQRASFEDSEVFERNSKLQHKLTQLLSLSKAIDWKGVPNEEEVVAIGSAHDQRGSEQFALREQLECSAAVLHKLESDLADTNQQKMLHDVRLLRAQQMGQGKQLENPDAELQAEQEFQSCADELEQINETLSTLENKLSSRCAPQVKSDLNIEFLSRPLVPPKELPEAVSRQTNLAELALRWSSVRPELYKQLKDMFATVADHTRNMKAESLRFKHTALESAVSVYQKLEHHRDELQASSIPRITPQKIAEDIKRASSKLSQLVGGQFCPELDVDVVERVEESGKRTLGELAVAKSLLDEALKHAQKQLQTCNVLLRALLLSSAKRVSSAFSQFGSEILPSFQFAIEPTDCSSMQFRAVLYRQVRHGGKPSRREVNLAELSGGQRTLAAVSCMLAVAHIEHKPLYLFDEIDAALDEKNRAVISRLIKEMFASKAMVVIVSHHPELLEAASQVVHVTLDANGQSAASVEIPRKK